jgi:hypothetical protein
VGHENTLQILRFAESNMIVFVRLVAIPVKIFCVFSAFLALPIFIAICNPGFIKEDKDPILRCILIGVGLGGAALAYRFVSTVEATAIRWLTPFASDSPGDQFLRAKGRNMFDNMSTTPAEARSSETLQTPQPSVAPRSREWFILHNGHEVGPVSSAQLKQMAANGLLTRSDQVRTERNADWVVATKVKGLFS